MTVTRAEIQTTNQNGPIPLQGGNVGFGYVYTITFGGSLVEHDAPALGRRPGRHGRRGRASSPPAASTSASKTVRPWN